MKRSRTVTLVLMPLMAASLSGCFEDENKAVGMTEENMPKYGTQRECTREFGNDNCRQVHSGGGAVAWHPVLMPGQTYFYPPGSGFGFSGYYGGSPDRTPSSVTQGRIHDLERQIAARSPSGATPAAHGGAEGAHVTRGGFGQGAAAHGSAST